MALRAAGAVQRCPTITCISRKFSLFGKAINFSISSLMTALRNAEILEEQPADSNPLGTWCLTNQKGMPPDSETYACLLQECANTKSAGGKEIHAHVIKIGIESVIFVGNNLINMYAKCDDIKGARQVFDEMPELDVVSWNTMIAGFVKFGITDVARQIFNKMPDRDTISWNTLIAGYAQNGDGEKALKLFQRMHQTGVTPDRTTFAIVLKACASLECLEQGTQIHNLIIKSALESDVFIGSALVDMYAKCGSLRDAEKLFYRMPERSVVSWNAMIAGYAQNDWGREALKLLVKMQLIGLKLSQSTFASVLKVCASLAALEEGMEVHNHTVKTGFDINVIVGTALVDMYAKCGSLENARHVFDIMPKRNAISWNAIIVGYAQSGNGKEVLKLFRQMLCAGVDPDEVTFSGVLCACASLTDLQEGISVHNFIVKSGYKLNICVGNALVDMYAKCGNMVNACQVFDKMTKRDAISWNAMIAGHGQNGHDKETLMLFCQMLQAGLPPDQFTFGSVLKACASLETLNQGIEVHSPIIKTGLGLDVFVGGALVDMYCKCSSLKDARKLLDKMPEQSVVSWNAMMAGYTQNKHGEESLKLFSQMLQLDAKPDHFTFATILDTCSSLAAVGFGKQIHGHTIKTESDVDAFVASALVDMYAKCGSMANARKVFDKIPERDCVSSNAMIAGYGQHGHAKEAFKIFEQMQQDAIKPNHATFVGVLSACSRVGLLDEGYSYFYSMSQDYGLLPTLEHYACMVDLVGRAGCLDEAMRLINEMPFEADVVIWRTLLGACRVHGNVELGKHAAGCILTLEPEDAAAYVLLSNIYAAAGQWDDVAKVRKMMKTKGVRKEPGCSWIEVKNKVHTFIVGDKSHPQSGEIYEKLEELTKQMKDAGYMPETNVVLHYVEEEQKEHFLCHHSEKLAIAFGLIRMPVGTPIQIFKNLRVCGDCHTATKFISKIAGREIVVRDTSRFHHFNGGICSCGNYW
eukprot:Gb_09654 [translate_table: standard]